MNFNKSIRLLVLLYYGTEASPLVQPFWENLLASISQIGKRMGVLNHIDQVNLMVLFSLGVLMVQVAVCVVLIA